MSKDDIRRVEEITGVARRRYWPAHEKLRIIEDSLAPGESVSTVAGRNDVAPNLLFRWRRLMEGGAAGSGEPCRHDADLWALRRRASPALGAVPHRLSALALHALRRDALNDYRYANHRMPQRQRTPTARYSGPK